MTFALEHLQGFSIVLFQRISASIGIYYNSTDTVNPLSAICRAVACRNPHKRHWVSEFVMVADAQTTNTGIACNIETLIIEHTWTHQLATSSSDHTNYRYPTLIPASPCFLRKSIRVIRTLTPRLSASRKLYRWVRGHACSQMNPSTLSHQRLWIIECGGCFFSSRHVVLWSCKRKHDTLPTKQEFVGISLNEMTFALMALSQRPRLFM